MLTAWSPFCRQAPASGIRNPQTNSEQQEEHRGNLRFKWVFFPWKGLSEKQYPQFLWSLPQQGHMWGQRDTNHCHRWHGAWKLPSEARDILREPESSEGKDYTKPAQIHRVRFACLFWKMLQSKPKGTRLLGDSESRALEVEYSFLLDEGWSQQEFLHLNSVSLSLCAEIKSAGSVLP